MVFGGVGGGVVGGGGVGGVCLFFFIGSLLFSEHFYVCPFVFSYTDYYVGFALISHAGFLSQLRNIDAEEKPEAVDKEQE